MYLVLAVGLPTLVQGTQMVTCIAFPATITNQGKQAFLLPTTV